MIFSTLNVLLKDIRIRDSTIILIANYLKVRAEELKQVILDEGIDEFVCGLYVTAVESNFVQHATSHRNAKGFFQMTDTASREVNVPDDIRTYDYVGQYRFWIKYARKMKFILKNGAIEWASICNYKPANRSKFRDIKTITAVYSNSEMYFPYELDRDKDGVVTSEDYAVWMLRKAKENWLRYYTMTLDHFLSNQNTVSIVQNKGIVNGVKTLSYQPTITKIKTHNNYNNERFGPDDSYDRCTNLRDVDLNGW